MNCLRCGQKQEDDHRCKRIARSIDERRDPSRLFNPDRTMIFCDEVRRGDAIIRTWRRTRG